MKKDYQYYYNQTNPKEPQAMREIHAIRLMHHDQTKHMTTAELVNFYNEGARKVVEDYGLRTTYAKKPV